MRKCTLTNPNVTVVNDDAAKHPLTKGVMTSEFWVTIAAIALPFVFSLSDTPVMQWAAAHGWVGGLVASVYVGARAYVKGSALRGPQ